LNALGFPTLLTPTVIIDMPAGERINDFDVYLGTYAVLATSAGFRVGVADATGDVQYGPLLFRDAACTAIAFKDSYAYIATLVDGEAGLVRTDLSTTVIASALYFPWAWDLIAAGTSATASQVAFFGNSDRLAFATGNTIWAESTTSLVSEGYLRTGFITVRTNHAGSSSSSSSNSSSVLSISDVVISPSGTGITVSPLTIVLGLE